MTTNCKVSQDRIEHLEEIGCQWQGIDCDGEFEKRCHGLKAIKGKFGIQHWKDGVATRKQHTRKSKSEWKRMQDRKTRRD
jgi:hypothetical protein